MEGRLFRDVCHRPYLRRREACVKGGASVMANTHDAGFMIENLSAFLHGDRDSLYGAIQDMAGAEQK